MWTVCLCQGPLEGMTSDQYQLRWNSCMWPAVQCFCAAAKEELGWGERGGGGRTRCVYFPPPYSVQPCPTLSSSAEFIKKKVSWLCPCAAFLILLSRATSQVALSKRRRRQSLGGWLTGGKNREDLHLELEVDTIIWSCTSCPSKYSRQPSLGGWFTAGQNKPPPPLRCLYWKVSVIKQKWPSCWIRSLHNRMKPYFMNAVEISREV